MLIREARVAPEWEFSGHVEAPEFAKAMQNALGEKRGPERGQREWARGQAEKEGRILGGAAEGVWWRKRRLRAGCG